MNKTVLVTGSNGHLGQHVVKQLLEEGYQVKAGQRQVTSNTKPLPNLELCYTEMLDQGSLNKAMQNADIVIHCAAVFKHWAKDPQKEIVDANVEGTRNIMKACSDNKIKRLIYVSSVAAVGHENGHYLNEEHWNEEQNNAYYQSKIESEKLASQLAKQFEVEMVSILPSAMLGPVEGRLTDTMNFVHDVYHNKLPINPNFHFNFVDARDVATGIINAIVHGKPGERYILSNQESSSLSELIEIASVGVQKRRQPINVSKTFLKVISFTAELMARLTGKPAQLTRSQVDLFFGVKQNYDNAKAKKALRFKPRSPEQSLKETFEFFKNQR